MLQAAALRGVVVDVVGGDDGRPCIAGQRGQFPVAPGVAFQEVALQLRVRRIGAEAIQPVAQQHQGLGSAALGQQCGQRPVAPAGEQRQPGGVLRQMPGIETGIAAVSSVGQDEEAERLP